MSSERNGAPSMGVRIGRIVVVLAVLAAAAYFGVPLAGSRGGGPAQSGGTPAASGHEQAQDRAADGESPPAAARERTERETGGAPTTTLEQTQARVVRLMKERRSGQMVAFDAEIVKLLPDDNEGSRHQRFLLRVEDRGAPHDTILVAHNIDLAARVPAEEGDVVSLYGQYEFNDLGGVVHWTHHDPRGRHEDGWIEHEGVRYE